MKKKFPSKYIKKGAFKLHSGEISDTFYDVNHLLTSWDELYSTIIHFIDSTMEYYDTYVGIATGGAIIASNFIPYAMIKDGEVKGEVKGDYCLIDDVVTTESSIREAIHIIGYKPKKIYVVKDRRKVKVLEIISIYE